MKGRLLSGINYVFDNAVMPEKAAFFYFNQRVFSFLVRNPG